MAWDDLTDEEMRALELTQEQMPVVITPSATVPSKPHSTAFIPPAWYPMLRYALTAVNANGKPERGAMIFGPRGSGKSTAIRELAKQVGAKTATLQCASNMQIDSLIGGWTVSNGTTVFVEGPLTICVRNGWWLLAEEANVIAPGVWSAVNTLTDKTGDGLLLPTGELIDNHADFRLILLFNEGTGYQGTKEVNAALKRRLVPVYADYPDAASEKKILANLCPYLSSRQIDNLINCATMVRAAGLDRFDLSTDILARWADTVREGVGPWPECFKWVIMDLLGAPSITIQARQVLAQIALQCGMDKW